MNADDLKRHYHIRTDKTVGDFAEAYQVVPSSVYGIVAGSVPWTLERILIALKLTGDPTLIEELASRIDYFVIPKPQRKHHDGRLPERISKLSRKLRTGKRVRPSEAEKVGLALVAYSVSLRSGGIQKELDL